MILKALKVTEKQICFSMISSNTAFQKDIIAFGYQREKWFQ